LPGAWRPYSISWALYGPIRLGILALALLVGVGGCSLAPPQVSDGYASGHPRVVTVARRQLGIPYHYGGSSPRYGFDCSGLVYYAYARAGYRIPRTTAGQFDDSRRVSPDDLEAGDILFFRFRGQPSHVGLYIGHGRFIHAPAHGQRVSYASLHNEFWRERLVKIGRF